MHKLSIDIETYSSINLRNAGLYRYAQSVDFEILLFAFSLDDGPVQVVDLKSGQKIPEEILIIMKDRKTILYFM